MKSQYVRHEKTWEKYLAAREEGCPEGPPAVDCGERVRREMVAENEHNDEEAPTD